MPIHGRTIQRKAQMSYQVLARKWRPSNFSQVAGQSHVLQSLVNALDNERLHHAYLFTGTRGVGKTTLARILAKCLNCEGGITSKPCESCNACTEINEGRFVDLIEVDAASRTKVDDTRELLDNVQYAPARGRFKVYLIDEVHMLSNHSFNALLKTLEEPPPHVKFLFATTDPQKLPVTILSRCLQFNLKNLSPELIEQYLVKVLDEEGINYDPEALWQIAAAARGSMRDALTLADQAISYCEGQINASAVVEMLGVPQHQQVIALLNAMADRDTQKVLTVIRDMAEQSPDYSNTLDSLLSAMHRLALAQVAPQAVDNSFGDRQDLLDLAARFSAEDIQLYYQIGSKGREELRLATDLRVAFEMLLLRMLVFSPRYTDMGESGETKNAQPATQETEAARADAAAESAEESQKKKSLKSDSCVQDAQSAARVAPAAATSPDKKLHPDPSPAVTPPTPQEPSVTEQELQTASNTESAAEIIGDAEEITNAQPVKTLADMNHQEWLKVYFQLKASGIVANVLANTEWVGVSGTEISFSLDEAQSAVYNEDLNQRLEQVLSDYFAQPVAVTVTVTSTDAETPAALSQRLREEKHARMVNEFETDENVQRLVQRFSATVATDTIAPLKE